MRVLWDIDTQNDFISGALPVPNADLLKQTWQHITQLALNHGIPIYGSVDAHNPGSPEFQKFPPHCIRGTYGQVKILETQIHNSVFVPDYAIDMKYLKEIARRVKTGAINGVYFEKDTIDVASNANLRPLLEVQGVDEAVVYGIATDYCVKRGVLALLNLGIQVYLLEDAIMGVSPDSTRAAIEEMVVSGAKLIKTPAVLQ